ncbi:MAG: hypothetical protein JWQ66_2368 [Mucilaginibacter sp.]|nr:hypothetical protein [Mucilaginibacter sp.]
MVKLFIVGIPRDMDEVELLEICSVYGIVDTVKVITDKETGLGKGYGFLFMNDTGGADRLVAAMNGGSIDDREITVRLATDNAARNRPDRLSATNRHTAEPRLLNPQPGNVRRKRPRKIR